VTKSAGHVDREQEPPSALGHQRDMPVDAVAVRFAFQLDQTA
jgi:hypothetical protein